MRRVPFMEVLQNVTSLTPEQLARAEEVRVQKGIRLDEALLQQRLISEDELRQVQAHHLGLPYWKELPESTFDPTLMTKVPLAFARQGARVVVNDIGALFVGSATGKTPLRGWISPNKSVEGFIGGAVLTIVAMVIINALGKSANWNGINLIILGLVISIMAPLGDLTESMFKRNLDIKDFGSIVKGHGGVLDRFDGFLFTLPAVYYLTLVLEPWQHALVEFLKK